jgi:hypothetical protein
MTAKEIVESCDVVDRIVNKDGTYSLHTEDRVRYQTKEGTIIDKRLSKVEESFVIIFEPDS